MKKISVGMRFLAAMLVLAIVLTVSFIPNSNVKATVKLPPGRTTDANVNVSTLSGDWTPAANAGMIPYVKGPIKDGVDLNIPTILGAPGTQQYINAQRGYIDVKGVPFNAVGDGTNLDTDEIQYALDFAREHQYAVYFPAGTFLIQNTLRIYSGITVRSNFTFVCNKNENPNVLIGSRGSDGLTNGAAIIKLNNGAPGFGDPDNSKAIIHYHQPRINKDNAPWFVIHWGTHASNLEGNLRVEGLRIITGNNPGAIGVHFASAEGAVLQDLIIDADGGLCGILGGSGNGGSWTNITVNGGKIGIDTRIPTITVPQMQNITLNDQNKIAWMAGGTGSTVVTGMKIIAKKYSGPAIMQKKIYQQYFGTIALIDVSIDYQTAAKASFAIAGTSSMTTLETASTACDDIPAAEDIQEGLYLQNVYVKNCSNFVRSFLPTGTTDAGWSWMKEYAYGHTQSNGGVTWYAPSIVGGTRYANEYENLSLNRVNGSAPPPDIASKHGWALADSPNISWLRNAPAGVTIANVITGYSAAGNGVTDDTTELQNAINANEYVFLPKGYYAISNTLTLKSNTKLFGVSSAFSTIIAHPTFVNNTAYPAFDAGSNVPLVQTPNLNTAAVVICDLGISPPSEMSTVQANNCMPIYSLKWQCGGTKSMVHSVLLEPIKYYGFSAIPGGANAKKGLDWNKPLLQVTNNGGGRIYNIFMALFGENTDYNNMNMITVKNRTAGSTPLKFYSLEAQYIDVAKIIDINMYNDVTIYQLKSECTATLLTVQNSSNFNLYGLSGTATGLYNNDPTYHDGGTAPVESKKGNLIYLNSCTNFRIVNMCDQQKLAFDEQLFGLYWLNKWDYFYPIKANNQPDNSPFESNERPVLYKVGSPTP